MKNKIGIIFLVLGMAVVTLVTGAGGIFLYKKVKQRNSPARYAAAAPVKAVEGVKIFTAGSLDRIFQDGKTLVKPNFGEAVTLSAAQNEYESFQVVIQSERDLAAVSLQISDLFNPSVNAKIDPKNISWRVVGYVPTVEPYYPVKYIGEWPDPLMPAASADVSAKTTQPFWITVYVSPETPAGDYQGKIQVLVEGNVRQEIPVDLHVYAFVLPKENHLKTAFDFYGHHTKNRYPQGESESEAAYLARLGGLNEKYLVTMLKYRMNPILNVDPTSQVHLAAVDRYRVHGLNNFSIGRRGGTLGNNWPLGDKGVEDLLGQYRTYGEMLKLNKLLQYTYIYTWDEGKIGNPRVSKIASMIHRAYPGLKNMVCYHGFWDPDELPGWGKDVDIWCFHIDNFIEAKMQKLKKIGMEIWMYVSGPSGYTSPNLAMDFDSLDYRIIPWLCWKYDIKGFLYWCVNWWPKVDPFKSAKNTDWEQNGNGLLFYPGKDGPIASLRLEIFRDGIEDYEYLVLLKEKLKLLGEKNVPAQYQNIYNQARDLLRFDPSFIGSMFQYVRDNEILQARRDMIGKTIEELDKILLSLNAGQ